MPTRLMSIPDLERELLNRRSTLAKLERQRQSLLTRLARVEKQIAKIGGPATISRGPKAARGPQAAALKAPGPGRRVSGESLIDYIKAAIKKSPAGMRVRDIATAVQKAGYATTSKDFYPLVATAVREGAFARVGRGVYKLA